MVVTQGKVPVKFWSDIYGDGTFRGKDILDDVRTPYGFGLRVPFSLSLSLFSNQKQGVCV